MKTAKILLSSGAAVCAILVNPSVAQEAILGVRGCGAGCRIETTQLSAPSRMGDGWAKVLERSSMYIMGMDGIEEKYFRGRLLPAVEQYWVFAKCNDKWLGKASKVMDLTQELRASTTKAAILSRTQPLPMSTTDIRSYATRYVDQRL